MNPSIHFPAWMTGSAPGTPRTFTIDVTKVRLIKIFFYALINGAIATAVLDLMFSKMQ